MNFIKEHQLMQRQLQQLADPKRAQGEKKYLKSALKHYGITVPRLHTFAASWFNKHPHLSVNQLVDLSAQLWQSDWYEERSLAVMILETRKKDLTLKHMPVIEHMLKTANTWALLDGLAVWVIGALIDTDPKTYNYLKKWIKSNNFWVRRSALLAQITQFRQGRGDLQLFQEFALSQFPHEPTWDATERFFIRKAIGWALRERVPADPESVYNFVIKYRSQMSGLTFREATRKLPNRYKSKLNITTK